jgi:endonuclease/exonuclease/phosphatase family metal-dependent hydrolase
MNDLVTGSFGPFWPGIWPSSAIRVVNWNIERGLRLREVTEFFASQNPDLLTLQEVDLNARRTRRLNIAEEIARRLKMNYVFAREFEELTQGSRTSPAYHGQATLSRWRIINSRVIRFRQQSDFWRPRWFLPRASVFQERLGGRIALVAQVEFAGTKLTVYNLHLESRGDNRLRLAQLDEVLQDAERSAGQCRSKSPVLIAGDLNFDASEVFRDYARRGLDFRSALSLPATATTPPHGFFSQGRAIDWAFVSGPINASQGRVHHNVKASDHYPLTFTIKA